LDNSDLDFLGPFRNTLSLFKINSHEQKILMILDGWGKSPDPKVSAIDNIMYLLLTAFIKITQVLN
jgi:hypothetical protein